MQPERSAVGPHGPRVDAVALHRTVRRLVGGGQVPWLHEEAARRMAERLPLIRRQPAVLLDCSGPLGGSASLLQAAYPTARHLAVGMPGQTPPAPVRKSWWAFGRKPATPVETVRPEEIGPGLADLLWSNMALHLAADPQALFAAWHRVLAVDGFLMFSTLGPGTMRTLRELFVEAGWGEAFAPFVDMHDLGDMLVEAGFADPVMDQETLTLTWPDAGRLLAELRGLGGNMAAGRMPGLRTPRWRAQLRHALGERLLRPADGRLALEFEVVYGHAFRPLPRARVAAETALPLDDLRAMVRQRRHGVSRGPHGTGDPEALG